MAFTAEDLELLGSFIDKKITAAVESHAPAEVPAAEPLPREAQVGVPDVPFDAGPLYWIHLANGEVIQSHDSASTHMPDAEGRTQLVIGRYQAGS